MNPDNNIKQNSAIKNILFVTHNFPPLRCIASLRVGQWAKYWGKSGCKVTILTTKKYSFDGICDLHLPLPSNIKIILVDYLPTWLTKSTLSKHTSHSSWFSNFKKIIHHMRSYVGSIFDIHNLWIKKGVKTGLQLMRQGNYDIIVSSFGPPSSHIIAAKIKKQHSDIPWIADYRDLWTDNQVVFAKGIFKVFEQFAEIRSVKKYADCTTTVAETFADNLRKKLEIESFVIENGFDPDEFPNWETRITEYRTTTHFYKRKPIIITYTGKIYSQKRDPSPLFRVLNKLAKDGFIKPGDIEIHFYGSDLGNLPHLIKKENAQCWVKLMGQIPWKHVLEAQQKSDLLLFLVWEHPYSKGSLTGKLFEYIVSGKPILALGLSPDMAAGIVISKTKTGLICGSNENKIYTAIKELVNTGYLDCFKPNINEIKNYSRPKQAQRMLEIFHKVKSKQL